MLQPGGVPPLGDGVDHGIEVVHVGVDQRVSDRILDHSLRDARASRAAYDLDTHPREKPAALTAWLGQALTDLGFELPQGEGLLDEAGEPPAHETMCGVHFVVAARQDDARAG